MNLEQPTLTGEAVRLEPLTTDHHQALCQVAFAPEIWRWTVSPVLTREAMWLYIKTALKERDAGTALPFATVDLRTGTVVGSTRFGNIDGANRRVEIGWTFVAPPWQRTRINTEAKYLMLRYAFETLGCIRVELKTDSLNAKSRAAILRLGATEEGTFRNHMIVAGGRIRHTVYFSIIESEWPGVKASLQSKFR
jgi:RimJ/RimL family protein N-acetyltransferase